MSSAAAPRARTDHTLVPNVVTKRLSPTVRLVRIDRTRAVVYDVVNDAPDTCVIFTMNFCGSRNMHVVDSAGAPLPGLTRAVVVPPASRAEAARVEVTDSKKASKMRVKYTWEEESEADAQVPQQGKPRVKRETVADGVDLVTKRIDTVDGHTRFDYVIEKSSNKTKEDISVQLDFAGSSNLTLSKPFLVRLFGGGSTKAALTKKVRLGPRRTSKKVATLRTTHAHKNWSLQHKITVGLWLPKRFLADKQQRIAAGPTGRSSSAAAAAVRAAAAAVSRRSTGMSALLQTRNSQLTTVGQSRRVSVVKLREECLVPEKAAAPANSGPAPPPYDLSWLEAESAPENNGPVTADVSAPVSLEELLKEIGLEEHLAQLVGEAMDNLTLLRDLAGDSKADFRTALKEAGISRVGHREAILRAILAQDFPR